MYFLIFFNKLLTYFKHFINFKTSLLDTYNFDLVFDHLNHLWTTILNLAKSLYYLTIFINLLIYFSTIIRLIFIKNSYFWPFLTIFYKTTYLIKVNIFITNNIQCLLLTHPLTMKSYTNVTSFWVPLVGFISLIYS